jgi:hypothetical protein
MPIQALSLNAEQLAEFVRLLYPSAHGHLVKALVAFILALTIKTSGCQAELARAFDNQEAASRRLGRLIHNPDWDPRRQADELLAYGLARLPRQGLVRVVIDWTSEADQHLLVVSLVVGRRALPLYWRAYDATVLKGRMGRYERAVLHRVLTQLIEVVGARRVRLLADRGFADVELCEFLEKYGVFYCLRVKGSTKVWLDGRWQRLDRTKFVGNSHFRNLGRIPYCESAPHQLWVNLARRKHKGKWQRWYLITNRPLAAREAAVEYGRRMGTEEGFRDVKYWLGFKAARIRDIVAWSRMFALCALALWAIMAVALTVLLTQPRRQAWKLLRRVCSRRRGRSNLSLFKAMLSLLQQNLNWFTSLFWHVTFDLDARLPNVS